MEVLLTQRCAESKYADGNSNGPWKWYRETGKLTQTGSFDQEKRVGLWKRYHPNGRLFDEGEYDGEKQLGEWRTYDAKGNLLKTTRHRPR